MAKFYKVIKDHPYWEVGAVISNEDGDDEKKNDYAAINDLWVKEVKDLGNPEEYKAVVENRPEWFERVYKVTVLKQAKYLTKEAAKKAHEELYKA